jgi:hypothetical protein
MMSETDKAKPEPELEQSAAAGETQLDRIERLLKEIHAAVVSTGRQLGH